MKDAIRGTEAIRNWNEHKMKLQELEAKYNTDFKNGLSAAIAKLAHDRYGDNALTKKIVTPWYCLLAKEMFGGFQFLLWIGSLLCYIGFLLQNDYTDKSNVWLGVVLDALVIITSLFSFFQQSKAADMMA